MEGATAKDDEPIFDLAVECERLYTAKIARLKEDGRTNHAAILSEFSHQFDAWAAYLGVFAESEICLDRRLHHHAEIQEQILLPLDIMERNLVSVFQADEEVEHSDEEVEHSDEEGEHSDEPQNNDVNIENLEAISEAIERLNNIGIAIRQSSVTSHATKAREFAEAFDFASFERFAYLALKTKYVAADEGLLQLLTRSMTETYAGFLQRKSRYEKLRAPRSEPQVSVPLSTILEETAADMDVGNGMDLGQQMSLQTSPQISQQSRNPPILIPQPPLNSGRTFRNKYITSSEATSVDSKTAKAKISKILSPSKKSATTSIVVNQADYPRPAKDTMNCEWCFSPLPTNVLEGDNWPKHVDGDHQPYLCIAERCPNTSPRYATKREWREHMIAIHGPNWHLEAYPPPSWVCPVCLNDDTAFSVQNELASHLANSHGNIFTQSQIQAIAQQSQVLRPRNENVCLLCCYPIEAQQNPRPKEKSESSQETSIYRRSQVDADESRSRKRIRTEQQQESKNPPNPHPNEHLTVESIADHIAGHLQAIMTLTLRMISIDGEIGVSADNLSEQGGTDDHTSRPGSIQSSIDQESYTIENSKMSEDGDADSRFPEEIPDSGEHFTSNNVFPASDASDNLLHEMMKFKTSVKDKTFRIRGVPLAWDRKELHDFLEISSGDAQPRVSSLALEVHKRTQTATANFMKIPQQLQDGTNWIIPVSFGPDQIEDSFVNLEDDFAGITTLYSPPSDAHHIDIIAISGIGGHAFESFKERGGEHMWLRDALPYDITGEENNTPISRVMIYGYDSKLQDSNIFQNLDDLASGFIEQLRGVAIMGVFRPIILVAHSLGGLIIKEALISLSKSNDEQDRNLLRAVYGIAFFGVPQNGMEIRSLISIVENAPDRFLLESIGSTNSQVFTTHQREFPNALGGQGDSKIIYFYETQSSPTAKQDERGEWKMTEPATVLVSKMSATHSRPWENGPEYMCTIDRSHSEMVRFRSEDSEYEKVVTKLRSLAQEARKARDTRDARDAQEALIAQKRLSQPTLSRQALDCLKSLAFDNMKSRSLEIESAAAGTYEWLFQHETFRNWSEFNQEILWIKGKPGSGKSTLLNYAFANQKHLLGAKDSDLVLSFFFHGRGGDLQKTPLGFFRSLLHQILQQMPGCLSDLVNDFENKCKVIGEYGEKWQWHPEELWSAFESTLPEILKTRSVWLFVDALNECGEDNATDLVQKFELLFKRSVTLSAGTNHLRICFSCRHYPILSSPGLAEVCLEKENQADIHTYVTHEMSSYKDSISSTILETIIERASGVFLWAHLVVKKMQKRALDGMRSDLIQKEVYTLPEELESLYTELIRDMTNASRMLMAWISFAERPLSVEELRWAMATDARCSSLQACQNTEDYIPDDELMRQRIVSLSRGLAEIQSSSDQSIVQFIHQSVNDCFIHKGLFALWRDARSINEAIGLSHLYLYDTCIRYLMMDEIQNYEYYGREEESETFAELPFLDYALESWMLHMKQSDDYNTPAEQILVRLPQPACDLVEFWVYTYELIHGVHPDDDDYDYPSLLHVVAAYDIQGVLNAILQRPGFFSVEVNLTEGAKRTALLIAAKLGHEASVKLLLATGQAEIDIKDCLGQTALSHAAEKGHEAVLRILLATGQADINSKNGASQTPLLLAARNGHEAVVELLLATGQVEIDSKANDGRTPLSWAAEIGHEEVVELLLATSQADVNFTDKNRMTPLALAAKNGHEAVVELLLATGQVGIDLKDNIFAKMPLSLAAASGHEEVVKLLLATGQVDVNSIDARGMTPLAWAAKNGHEAVVKLLLATGQADINSTDVRGMTPLAWAAEKGHEAVVSLLQGYACSHP